MKIGAGTVAAERFGAAALVDPRPYLVGRLRETFATYPEHRHLAPGDGIRLRATGRPGGHHRRHPGRRRGHRHPHRPGPGDPHRQAPRPGLLRPRGDRHPQPGRAPRRVPGHRAAWAEPRRRIPCPTTWTTPPPSAATASPWPMRPRPPARRRPSPAAPAGMWPNSSGTSPRFTTSGPRSWPQASRTRSWSRRSSAPVGFPALLARCRAGVEHLASTLAAADPAAPVWTWARQKDAGFVIRHQAQETAVHRWDAEHAAGRAFSIEPAPGRRLHRRVPGAHRRLAERGLDPTAAARAVVDQQPGFFARSSSHIS